MARYFKGSPAILRFIEYMDVGASNGWKMDEVIPSAEVVRRISEQTPLEEVEPNYTGETAERWRYVDGSGEIGVISSVTQAFCSDCNRARLSTEGKLFTCLFLPGVMICARCCVRVTLMRKSLRRSRICGRNVMIGTPNCAPSIPMVLPVRYARWRCRTSAVKIQCRVTAMDPSLHRDEEFDCCVTNSGAFITYSVALCS